MGVKVVGVKHLSAALKRRCDPALLKQAVKINGAEMHQKSQRNAPYDTGNLRRSIQLDITDGGMTAEVTATAHYAQYVEYGTRYMRAQPYMKPAFNAQKQQFIKDVRKAAEG